MGVARGMTDILAQRPSHFPTLKEAKGWLGQGEVALALGVIGIVLLLVLPIRLMLVDHAAGACR